MREINSVLEFLGWAETTIREAKTQVRIPVGLLLGFHDIFHAFDERGSLILGDNPAAWGSHLSGLLEGARQRDGKTDNASALVNYFVGELYARAIGAQGTATLNHLVATTRNVLNIEPSDLYFDEKTRLLRSSAAFDERFFHRVRVPIPRKPTGSVATHRSHAPHGTGRRLIR